MKTLRIVNDGSCSYVERQFCRRLWLRVTPKYRTNIEAYNWVRKQGKVNLLKKASDCRFMMCLIVSGQNPIVESARYSCL